jgi:hypothetical protein
MNQFPSIRKIDQAILYSLELASSLSIILLAFGLIASMANVLTKGSVLSDNLVMQRVWAWSQCVAIDASVAGTITRTYHHFEKRAWAMFLLYALLSTLLLFTAAIVSNIESVQQTLNISLESAYIHVFIPVEALIWVRSVVIVLLIVAHALRHVQSSTETQEQQQQQTAQALPALPTITPEILNQLHVLLSQTSVSEEQAEVITEQPETPPQIAATASSKESQEAQSVPQTVAVLPDVTGVTEEEKNRVIEAYRQGISRREMCAHLRWGSGKYTTIVKPVLDAYERQMQQAGSGKE